ncbi:hypothetical protein KKB55_04440 [Myxococcota bacterium]|nr:hypothetical protein [Myxococcota bacterium]MBU1897001.1 hypothetical protein [Myxococcota bacterium]
MSSYELPALAALFFLLWSLFGLVARLASRRGAEAPVASEAFLINGGFLLCLLSWRLARRLGPGAMRIASKLVTFGGIFFLVDYLIGSVGL